MIGNISILYGLLLAACMIQGACHGLSGLPLVTSQHSGRQLPHLPFAPVMLCLAAMAPLLIVGSLVSGPTLLGYVICRNFFRPKKQDPPIGSRPQNTSERGDSSEE